MLFLLSLFSGFQSAFSAAITFCSKPPGSWIAAAIAACLGLWWFGQHEYTAGKLACEAAHVEAVRLIHDKQIAAINGAEGRSEARTKISVQHDVEIQKVIVHVKDMAAALPTANAECVPADIADRLRGMR